MVKNKAVRVFLLLVFSFCVFHSRFLHFVLLVPFFHWAGDLTHLAKNHHHCMTAPYRSIGAEADCHFLWAAENSSRRAGFMLIIIFSPGRNFSAKNAETLIAERKNPDRGSIFFV